MQICHAFLTTLTVLAALFFGRLHRILSCFLTLTLFTPLTTLDIQIAPIIATVTSTDGVEQPADNELASSVGETSQIV